MGHLNTATGEHDATASAYIVRLDFDEPKIMLHKHKKLGIYLQFGGHVERKENPWDAIMHEIAEESGYLPGQLKVLQPPTRLSKLDGAILHPYPIVLNTHQYGEQDHFHSDIVWAFVTDQEPAGRLAQDESSDIRIFSRKELLALPENQISVIARQIALAILETYLNSWETVPLESAAKP